MNILTNEEMKLKEKKLLQLYNHGDMKFKLNLQELIEAKQRKRDLFCFHQADKNMKLWIKKLVPLNKKVQTISLQQQQNGLFKVLAHIFMFIIFKQEDSSNQYVKDQLKCSLYSDDIDLFEIKNHSFNKKMKSDHIKSMIAQAFKEIQYLLKTDIVRRNNIKAEQLISFALQKNDMVSEGFHLFYRNILSKLEVQNAKNCVQQVSPQQAISNLIEYFEIQCRVFNDLYLFNQVGVFIALIQDHSLVFGRYYENQLEYQQTSEQQGLNPLNNLPQLQLNRQNSSQKDIQKNDVRNFKFILDTDRSQMDDSQFKFIEKNNEAETPCFKEGQQFKFGGRKNSYHCEPEKQLDTSFNKIKDRLQNEKINEIQSEQEDYEQKNQSPTPFLGGPNHFNFSGNQPNKFMNLVVSDDQEEDDFQQNDSAPTPMLGGGQIFCFGNNEKNSKNTQLKLDFVPNFAHETQQNTQKIRNLLENSLQQKKQIKTSAIRRQSYQVQNPSKSKSSDKKKLQMKTSKNQIQVIDQTASRMSLVHFNQLPKKSGDQYFKERKQTIGQFQKISSFSNCTCHIEKKNRIKLNSQIIEMVVETKQPTNQQNFSRKISTQVFEKIIPKPYSPKNVHNDHKNYIFKTQHNQRENFRKEIDKDKTPVKKVQKRQQFINFLKKDKTELIKKLSEKRNAKHNLTNGDIQGAHISNTQNKNIQGNRTFIKQSMFVGSYQFQNPEHKLNGKDQRKGAITPNHSMQKNYMGHGGGRQRSITPTQHHFRRVNGPQIVQTFKTNINSHKNSIDSTNLGNYFSQQNSLQSFNTIKNNFVQAHNQKPLVLFKTTNPQINQVNQVNQGSIRINTQPVSSGPQYFKQQDMARR